LSFNQIAEKIRINPRTTERRKDVRCPTFAFAATEVSISTKSEDYLLLKSTCDVNLLSKLSIIFKEWRVIVTGTCFIQKIYASSSSLLQGKHLPFSPYPLRLNIFPYLWSFRWPNYIVTLPRYFSFRLPHLNISTGPPSDKLDKNSQRMWLIKNFSQCNGWIIVISYHNHFVPAISYHSENHFRTITISYHCYFVPYADRYIITISYHMQIDTLWPFRTICRSPHYDHFVPNADLIF
jgi:hypothetical protein